MATKQTTKTVKRKKALKTAGVAAGVAAAAAAAGAAYYFYGAKNAKSHRRKAAAWANGMKREVVKQAKKVQDLDEVVMHGIVDRVARTYKAAKSADPSEIRSAAMELKKNWKMVAKELKDAGKFATGKRSAKRTAAAKKAAKKRA